MSSDFSSILSHFNLREEDCKKTVEDHHLDEISLKCCGDWKFLPSQLELEDNVVRDIDHKNCDEKEKRRELFREWKQKKGFEATYGKLIRALLKCEYRQDAEKVCELLCGSLQASNSAPQQTPGTTPSDHTPTQRPPPHQGNQTQECEGAVGLSHSDSTTEDAVNEGMV